MSSGKSGPHASSVAAGTRKAVSAKGLPTFNLDFGYPGRAEKLGSTYLLSAVVVDPATGGIFSSLREQADGQEAVLGAVLRLSDKVRDSLGEERLPIQGNSRALERATTPSLRALQLYSKGVAFVNQSEWNPAVQLLEQALAVDPDFASAHIYLPIATPT